MKYLTLLFLLLVPPAVAYGVHAWVTGESALPYLGPVDGRLRPCPPGMDCLSSEDRESPIAAIPYRGDPDEAWAAMLHLLRTETGAEYVDVVGDYMHLVFARPSSRLVEDVELLLDRENRVFQIRAFDRTDSPASGTLARVESITERWAGYEARGAARAATDTTSRE